MDKAAFGAASEGLPTFTSHSDPASQWTAARKGPAFFSYSDNHLIDTDHGVIVDVEATRSIRQAEVGSTQTMLNRVKATFDLPPEQLILDTAYGTGPMLGWLVDRKVAPHPPVFDKSGRNDGTSHISSAFSGWVGSEDVAHTAQTMNSFSPPPTRTSATWPSIARQGIGRANAREGSFLHRSKREKPDQKGARALFRAPQSSLATGCFSTDSSGSGPSLRAHEAEGSKTHFAGQYGPCRIPSR